jgi:hypothetical protein
VVLANATLVTVNETSYPDLYFALRGGMNNFGIVTHFTMRTFSAGKIFSGDVIYSADKRDAVVAEAYKLTTAWKNDTNLTFSYAYVYNQTTDQYIFAFSEAYTQPVLAPTPFEALKNISYETSTSKVDWMSNFALESYQPNGNR